MNREAWIPRAICLGLLLFLWGEITPWAWALAIGFLILSLVAQRRSWKSPSRWLTSSIAAVAGVLIYVPAGTLIGRDPSAALLAVLAGLKAFESREKADERTLHLIGLFMVTVLFLVRSDLWALIAGATGIAFFLFGLLRTQPASPSPELARRWVARLSLRSLPLTVLLFLIVPRLQHSGWWDIGPQGKTGFREALDPTQIESIEEDSTPVLRATWVTGSIEEPIFWRGAVLEATDGFVWMPGPRARKDGAPPATIEVPARAWHVDWVLEGQSGRWVFAPEGTLRLAEVDGPTQRKISVVAESGVWRWGSARGSRTHLEADVDPSRTRAGEFEERLLVTPAKGPQFEDWVRSLSAVSTRAAKVQRLTEKFRTGGFVYTRRPGRIKDIEAFFDAKRGFCEHYASATATILRGAGVPARVVVGYLGGEWNPIGRYQIVTRADAHAWVEWLDENDLWRTLDVTAVIPPADPLVDQRLRSALVEAAGATWWDRFRWGVDSVNYDFAIFMMNFDLDSQKQLWARVIQLRSAATVLAVLLILGLLIGLRWRNWSWANWSEPLEVRRYRRWFERGLERGWPLSWHEGPLENLRRARVAAPKESDRSEKIVEDYIRARFRPVVQGPGAS